MSLLPNTTQFPNTILDEWLPHLTGEETAVLCCLIRYTYDWQREERRITAEEFCQRTGYDRRLVLNTLWVLSQSGVVRRDPGPPPRFSLILDADAAGLGAKLARARSALQAKSGAPKPSPGEPDAPTEPDEEIIYVPAHTHARSSTIASSATASRTVPDGLQNCPVHETEETYIYPTTTTLVGHSEQDPDMCLPYETVSECHPDNETPTSIVVVDEKDIEASLLADMLSIGCLETQARNIVSTARANGRSDEWLRGWTKHAYQHAERPPALLQHMVEQNAELPQSSRPASTDSEERRDPYDVRISPERQAQIDAKHDVACQRTRADTDDRFDGTSKPTDEELEAVAWEALKASLRAPGPPVRPTPPLDDPQLQQRQEAEAELRALREKRKAGPSRNAQEPPQRQNPGGSDGSLVSSVVPGVAAEETGR